MSITKKIKSIIYYTLLVLIAFVALIILFINISPQFGSNPSNKQINKYETFSNFNEDGFQNLEETPMFTEDVSGWDFFKDEMVSPSKPNNNGDVKPVKNIIPNEIDYSLFKEVSPDKFKISWLGHSAFILNINGKIILLDPMLGTHAAPLPIPSLKRFNETLPLNLDSLANIDFVVISHDHYDHLDYSTIRRIKANVSTFIVPYGIGNHLRGWGVEDKKITELNWNEVFKINEIEFTSLPARHFSGRGPLNRNSTLWSSWAIKSSTIKIYFSGDSGYGNHFKQIGLEHGPFDISLIDCGQYNKAWKHSHMFPSQAVLAAKELNSNYFMPIHWGGFTLAMHPWDEPVKESIKLAKQIGLNYFTPKIGEIVSKEKLDKKFNSWWEEY